MNEDPPLNSTEEPASQVSDPDVFSRGSLMLTYDLLRKRNPSLALSIRNLVSLTPLPKINDETQNKNSDHFKINLDSFKVRAVVEGLMEFDANTIEQSPNEAQSDIDRSGRGILAKTLLEDWIALAHKMIAELPANQKPK